MFTEKTDWQLLKIIVVIILSLIPAAVVVIFTRYGNDHAQEETVNKEISVPVDDLVRMKTLAHKYLNERNRVFVSNDPDNDPNVADAPVIDPSEMSQELSERQEEDVELLRAWSKYYDNFATYIKVEEINNQGDEVIVRMRDNNYYHNNPELYGENLPNNIPANQDDRYYTFTRNGDDWILTDVILILQSDALVTPILDPTVFPGESELDHVIKVSYETWHDIDIPEELEKLDKEATEMIVNKWAIDEITSNEIERGTYSWD